jgi:hypothetical protein
VLAHAAVGTNKQTAIAKTTRGAASERRKRSEAASVSERKREAIGAIDRVSEAENQQTTAWTGEAGTGNVSIENQA